MTGQNIDGKRSIPEQQIVSAFEQRQQEYRTLFDTVNSLASRLYTGEDEHHYAARVADVVPFLLNAKALKQYDDVRGCYAQDTDASRQRIDDMLADFTDIKIFDCVERFMATDDDEENAPAPRSKRQLIPASAPDLYFIGKQVRQWVRAARLFSANVSVEIAENFHRFMKSKIESRLSLNTTIQYADPGDSSVDRAIIQHRDGTSYASEVREYQEAKLEDVFADEIPECFFHRVFGTRDTPETITKVLRFLTGATGIIVTTPPYIARATNMYVAQEPIFIRNTSNTHDSVTIRLPLSSMDLDLTYNPAAIRVDALKLDYYMLFRQQGEGQRAP